MTDKPKDFQGFIDSLSDLRSLSSHLERDPAMTLRAQLQEYFEFDIPLPAQKVFVEGTRPEIEEQLFAGRVQHLLKPKSSGRICVAFWLHEYCPLHNQQLTYLFDAIDTDPRFEVIILKSLRPTHKEYSELNVRFKTANSVLIPNDKYLESLDFIDIIIGLDYPSVRPVKLPKSAKRICCPHGTDIKYAYSLEFYGVGIMFDHLLAPSFAPHIFPQMDTNPYLNVFPKTLRDHESNTLTCIPFGSPKLETFIKSAADTQKSDIIYNVSAWGLETNFVKENLYTITEALLDNFPKRRLVFRAFPGETDTVLPILKELPQRPNFFLSTAASYIEDYKAGAALLYHRGSSAEVFALATEQPSILLDGTLQWPQGVVHETPIGYIATTVSDLIATLKAHLDSPEAKSKRIKKYREQFIPNAPQALSALLDNLEQIATDRPIKYAQYHVLSDNDDKSLAEQLVESAQRCEQHGYRIPMLNALEADILSEEPLFQFFAARSIYEHIYPSEATPTSWLEGLEYTARMFELHRVRPIEATTWSHIQNWLSSVFTERFVGLASFAAQHFTEDEFERYHEAIKRIPLGVWDKDGVPQILREQYAKRQEESRQDHESLLLAANLKAVRSLKSAALIDDAIEILETVLAIRPMQAEIHAEKADCHRIKGEHNKAIVHFEEALTHGLHEDVAEQFSRTYLRFLLANRQTAETLPIIDQLRKSHHPRLRELSGYISTSAMQGAHEHNE